MLSLRIISADHYMAAPIPGLDVTYSDFRAAEVEQVPVIRIFGSNSQGIKTCVHVHGVFPYICIPYDSVEPHTKLSYQIAVSLDKAINISLGNSNSQTKHVHKIVLVSGIPFYGYHQREHQFLKIYFYKPAIMKKAVLLLENGAVLNRVFQPHEAHVAFMLQFFIDFNLYGMSYIHFANGRFRNTESSATDALPKELLMPDSVKPVSTSQLEADVVSSDIVNPTIKQAGSGVVNPGLAAILDDEKQRRLDDGVTETPRLHSQRLPQPPTDSDQYYREKIRAKLESLPELKDSLSGESLSGGRISYPSETPAGRKILEASFVNVHSGQLDRTSNETTLELDLDGSVVDEEVVKNLNSSQMSQILNSSQLDEDDLELLMVMENLAHHTTQTVDAHSALGSQPSELGEDPVKEEVDSDEDEGDAWLDRTLFCEDVEDENRPGTPSREENASQHSNEDADLPWDDSFWNGVNCSMLMNEDQIPQLDGANDDDECPFPVRKRFGTRGRVPTGSRNRPSRVREARTREVGPPEEETAVRHMPEIPSSDSNDMSEAPAPTTAPAPPTAPAPTTAPAPPTAPAPTTAPAFQESAPADSMNIVDLVNPSAGGSINCPENLLFGESGCGGPLSFDNALSLETPQGSGPLPRLSAAFNVPLAHGGLNLDDFCPNEHPFLLNGDLPNPPGDAGALQQPVVYYLPSEFLNFVSETTRREGVSAGLQLDGAASDTMNAVGGSTGQGASIATAPGATGDDGAASQGSPLSSEMSERCQLPLVREETGLMVTPPREFQDEESSVLLGDPSLYQHSSSSKRLNGTDGSLFDSESWLNAMKEDSDLAAIAKDCSPTKTALGTSTKPIAYRKRSYRARESTKLNEADSCTSRSTRSRGILASDVPAAASTPVASVLSAGPSQQAPSSSVPQHHNDEFDASSNMSPCSCMEDNVEDDDGLSRFEGWSQNLAHARNSFSKQSEKDYQRLKENRMDILAGSSNEISPSKDTRTKELQEAVEQQRAQRRCQGKCSRALTKKGVLPSKTIPMFLWALDDDVGGSDDSEVSESSNESHNSQRTSKSGTECEGKFDLMLRTTKKILKYQKLLRKQIRRNKLSLSSTVRRMLAAATASGKTPTAERSRKKSPVTWTGKPKNSKQLRKLLNCSVRMERLSTSSLLNMSSEYNFDVESLLSQLSPEPSVSDMSSRTPASKSSIVEAKKHGSRRQSVVCLTDAAGPSKATTSLPEIPSLVALTGDTEEIVVQKKRRGRPPLNKTHSKLSPGVKKPLSKLTLGVKRPRGRPKGSTQVLKVLTSNVVEPSLPQIIVKTETERTSNPQLQIQGQGICDVEGAGDVANDSGAKTRRKSYKKRSIFSPETSPGVQRNVAYTETLPTLPQNVATVGTKPSQRHSVAVSGSSQLSGTVTSFATATCSDGEPSRLEGKTEDLLPGGVATPAEQDTTSSSDPVVASETNSVPEVEKQSETSTMSKPEDATSPDEQPVPIIGIRTSSNKKSSGRRSWRAAGPVAANKSQENSEPEASSAPISGSGGELQGPAQTNTRLETEVKQREKLNVFGLKTPKRRYNPKKLSLSAHVKLQTPASVTPERRMSSVLLKLNTIKENSELTLRTRRSNSVDPQLLSAPEPLSLQRTVPAARGDADISKEKEVEPPQARLPRILPVSTNDQTSPLKVSQPTVSAKKSERTSAGKTKRMPTPEAQVNDSLTLYPIVDRFRETDYDGEWRQQKQLQDEHLVRIRSDPNSAYEEISRETSKSFGVQTSEAGTSKSVIRNLKFDAPEPSVSLASISPLRKTIDSVAAQGSAVSKAADESQPGPSFPTIITPPLKFVTHVKAPSRNTRSTPESADVTANSILERDLELTASSGLEDSLVTSEAPNVGSDEPAKGTKRRLGVMRRSSRRNKSLFGTDSSNSSVSGSEYSKDVSTDGNQLVTADDSMKTAVVEGSKTPAKQPPRSDVTVERVSVMKTPVKGSAEGGDVHAASSGLSKRQPRPTVKALEAIAAQSERPRKKPTPKKADTPVKGIDEKKPTKVKVESTAEKVETPSKHGIRQSGNESTAKRGRCKKAVDLSASQAGSSKDTSVAGEKSTRKSSPQVTLARKSSLKVTLGSKSPAREMAGKKLKAALGTSWKSLKSPRVAPVYSYPVDSPHQEEDVSPVNDVVNSLLLEKPVSYPVKSVLLPEKPILIEEQRVSDPEQPVTVQKQPVTVQKQPVTVQKQPVTVQKQPVTVQEHPVTVQEHPVSVREQPVPSHEKRVSSLAKPVLVQKNIVSAKVKSVSFQVKPMFHVKTVTFLEKPVSSRDKQASSRKRSVSSQENVVSSQGKPVSSQEKPVSSLKKTVSSQERPVSSQEKPVSSKVEPVSVSDEAAHKTPSEESGVEQCDTTGSPVSSSLLETETGQARDVSSGAFKKKSDSLGQRQTKKGGDTAPCSSKLVETSAPEVPVKGACTCKCPKCTQHKSSPVLSSDGSSSDGSSSGDSSSGDSSSGDSSSGDSSSGDSSSGDSSSGDSSSDSSDDDSTLSGSSSKETSSSEPVIAVKKPAPLDEDGKPMVAVKKRAGPASKTVKYVKVVSVAGDDQETVSSTLSPKPTAGDSSRVILRRTPSQKVVDSPVSSTTPRCPASPVLRSSPAAKAKAASRKRKLQDAPSGQSSKKPKTTLTPVVEKLTTTVSPQNGVATAAERGNASLKTDKKTPILKGKERAATSKKNSGSKSNGRGAPKASVTAGKSSEQKSGPSSKEKSSSTRKSSEQKSGPSSKEKSSSTRKSPEQKIGPSSKEKSSSTRKSPERKSGPSSKEKSSSTRKSPEQKSGPSSKEKSSSTRKSSGSSRKTEPASKKVKVSHFTSTLEGTSLKISSLGVRPTPSMLHESIRAESEELKLEDLTQPTNDYPVHKSIKNNSCSIEKMITDYETNQTVRAKKKLQFSCLSESSFEFEEVTEINENDMTLGLPLSQDDEDRLSQHSSADMFEETVLERTLCEESFEKAVYFIPVALPPTRSEVLSSLASLNMPETINPTPYFSNYLDVKKKKEVGGTVLHLSSRNIVDLEEFHSGVISRGISEQQKTLFELVLDAKNAKAKWANIASSLVSDRTVYITPVKVPPSVKEVELWSKARAILRQEKRNPVKAKIITKVSAPLSPGLELSQGSDDSFNISRCSSMEITTPESVKSSQHSTPQLEPQKLSGVESQPLKTTPVLRRPRSRSGTRRKTRRLSIEPSLAPIREDSDDSHAPSPDSQDSSLRRLLLSSQFKNQVSPLNTNMSDISGLQIEGLNRSKDFRLPLENLQLLRNTSEHQFTTLLILELHICVYGELKPDPERDPIRAVFYTVVNDVPEDSSLPRQLTGVIAVDSPDASTPLLSRIGLETNVTYTTDEVALVKQVVEFVREWDPDIVAGYEIEMLSWGYLIDRANTLGVNLKNELSRVVTNEGSKQKKKKEGGDSEGDGGFYGGLSLIGRIVIDVWRLMRNEVALQSYSFENIAYHILHQRLPVHSFASLSFWWEHASHLYRWRTARHYLNRVNGIARILDQLDFIGRTSELARLFGIQFFEVLSRGSQFRVESMMLRLAKPLNFVPISPSVQQRARMRAPEMLPLIMEPESRFYSDPVIVLDFQSLYPSMIIAYNYCFSTCLGRADHLGKSSHYEFGCCHLFVPPGRLKKLETKLTVSPCGVAFVKPEVRRGVLPQMLEEILEARLAVKDSMKRHRDDKTLQRVLHARQLGLKLIANVTYGYTSANFSGRMPCIEVGDSVVSKGRETLERAITTVHSNENWRARVVYGDTDSLFVLVPGRSREEAFRIGAEIAEAVTEQNPSPVKLKLEKVYQPCILQTKKRYVGYMYESPNQKEPVYDAKGIETVRRDGCPAVAKMLEKTLRILFETADVSLVKNYVCRQFTKMFKGRTNLQDFIFAKEYRGMANYRPGACVPALELTRRWLTKDRRSEPRITERVPYVIVNGPPGLPLIHLVRSPRDLLVDPGLRLNVVYYITRAIIPPLERCLALIGADVLSWYSDLPRKKAYVFTVEGQNNARKNTISQYFCTVECVCCGQLTNKGICAGCRKRPQDVAVQLSEKLHSWEHAFNTINKVCQSCIGSTEDVNCISLDCPILYRRLQASREYDHSNFIRRLKDECRDLL